LSNDSNFTALLGSLQQFISQLGFSACRITNKLDQIHVYVSEKEWSRVESIVARQEKELLEAPYDGGVLSITFVNAGIGSVQQMTDAWLALNPLRCTKQVLFPHQSITQRALSTVRIDTSVLDIHRNYGPLEVKEITTDRFGNRRAKLSDGNQIIQTAPIPDSIARISLHEKLMVAGSLRLSRDSQRIELHIKQILPAPLVLMDIPQQEAVASLCKIATPTWSRSIIKTTEDLSGIVSTLFESPKLFLDIETARDPFNTSFHKITLIQIGDPLAKHVFLIEGGALENLNLIKPWLESVEHQKIIHYAPFEIERFAERAIYLNGVIDTRDLVHTYYPHLPNRALGFCLRWILGVAADKSLQDSKWEPPFSQQQYDYAHLDVELLSDLYDHVSAFAAAAEQTLDKNATLEQSMQTLDALDEHIALLCDGEPRLQAKQLELIALEEAITAALEKGQCSYDGSFGSYDLGRYIRVIDPKKLKNELERRSLFSAQNKQELYDMLCLSADSVQKISDALDPITAKAFFDALPQTLASLDTNPSYTILSRTVLGHLHQDAASIYDAQQYQGLLISELARLHSETTGSILEMLHGGIPDLLSLLGQRAVLCRHIADCIEQGESYEGACGIATRRQKQDRYAWAAMKNMIIELHNQYRSFDRAQVLQHLDSYIPRSAVRSFLGSLSELESEQIEKILIVTSKPTTKRDKSFFRPGVHDAL
jgi:hypothetical protein